MKQRDHAKTGSCFRRTDNSVVPSGDYGAVRVGVCCCTPGYSPKTGWQLSRSKHGLRGHGLVIERGGDIADADDADQAVIVDHGQVADVVPVHEMTRVLERIGGAA